MRRWHWVVGGLVLLVVVGWVIGGRDQSQVQTWCRNKVNVGENFLNVTQPPAGHLISVDDGVWKYDGGVTITVVDDQVYSKSCG